MQFCMINWYDKLRLTDHQHENDLIVEVNWNGSDQCKMLRFTLPDGSQSFISKEDLMSMLFYIGKPSEQNSMVPQIITKVRKHESLFWGIAHKDIRKGERIIFAGKLTCDRSHREEVISKSERNRLLASMDK